MEAAIITTYRCINKCIMCNIWKYPTKAEEEFKYEILNKLPKLTFVNITGGEPMLRDDIEEITNILIRKARRVVISTNGFLTDKIANLARKFKNKNFGIRISIEGLPTINDELRGLKNCFDHGLKTLLALHQLGLKDIGFGITVSDKNARDMLGLYELAEWLKVEFATACVHNSYYFHKWDNEIKNKDDVINCFKELINDLLRTKRIKNWFRAYFNYGIINYIKGKPRLLPCGAARDIFFLDPWGNIRPCNGLDEMSEEFNLGNLNEKSFNEIWFSEKARRIREILKNCPKNCWMIGTASPAMKRYIWKPIIWVIKNKIKITLGKEICLD
jgi:radical SAM protein with 4Fe4S-binding SPASM domain